MKSLPSALVTAAWLPAELTEELPAATRAAQTAQVQAIFRAEAGASVNPAAEKAFTTGLLSAAAAKNFLAWQPGEIDEQTLAVVPTPMQWDFLPLAESFAPPPTPAPAPEPEPAPEMVTLPQRARVEQEISAMLAQARLQSEEMLLAAQAEADQVLAQAEEEIEAQKQAAYAAGRSTALAELQSTLQAAATLVEAVRTWKTDLLTQGESLLVEMLKEMALSMFGEGARLDTAALQMNLNRVLENAQGLGDLNVFLNPRDARQLDPSWSEYQFLVTGAQVKVIPSEKITPGGCLVKGSTGMVDGRVETQLQAILKTIDETHTANG